MWDYVLESYGLWTFVSIVMNFRFLKGRECFSVSDRLLVSQKTPCSVEPASLAVCTPILGTVHCCSPLLQSGLGNDSIYAHACTIDGLAIRVHIRPAFVTAPTRTVAVNDVGFGERLSKQLEYCGFQPSVGVGDSLNSSDTFALNCRYGRLLKDVRYNMAVLRFFVAPHGSVQRHPRLRVQTSLKYLGRRKENFLETI
jgi:hypothetical protein